MSSEPKYDQDEVIWAKIRADPWWPGVIARIILDHDEQGQERQKALVNFIGDNTHSTLPLSHVAKYKEKYEEVTSKVRDRKLKESIQIADQIFTKSTSYQGLNRKLTLVEVNKLAQKKMMQKMVAKSRAALAQPGDVEEDSEENQLSSSLIKRQIKKLKPKRQYLRSNATRDSSSDLVKSSKSNKKVKLDEIKQENQLNLDLEFQNLLSQLSQSKPDYQSIFYKLKKILNEILNQKPSTDNILEILKNNNGKILYTIYKILKSKSDQFLEDNRLILPLLKEIKQTVDMLKNQLLKLFFDTSEIIQYLDQVTKSTGEKKNVKMFAKLQHQKDEFSMGEEQDINKSLDDSQSESWESQQPKQSYPIFDQELSEFQHKRILRSKQSPKQIEGSQQKKQKPKSGRQKPTTEKVDANKKIETKAGNQRSDTPSNILVEQKETVLRLINPNKRKRVCFKILGLLQSSYQLDKQKAQAITLKLEIRARKSDQLMGQGYTNLIKSLINSLKNRQITLSILDEYHQQKEEKRDSQLWELIVQGISRDPLDVELTQGLKHGGLGSVSQEDHLTSMQENQKQS